MCKIRDKNIGMRKSVMHLINIGGPKGLPVKLLREIYLGKYRVILEKTEGGGATDTIDKIIFLPSQIVGVLGNTSVDGITKEAKAIGLLYHEGTHAFIDNKLEASDTHFNIVNNIAQKYYSGGTFDDGSLIPDQELDSAVTEAAAWYVHVQILTWWLMKEIMHEITIQSPNQSKEKPNHTHIQANFSALTIQDLQQVKSLINRKHFGVSRAGGDTYKHINMYICPELKIYCDQVIMEGKIDNYEVSSLLRFFRI